MKGDGDEGFDPARYLSRVNGSDYLEVKWRLLWLRRLHPEAAIETELIAHADGVAIFRALVAVPHGGSATGYGSESADDFRDYLEKAETKALGRALAALGFGTQFCADHVRGEAETRAGEPAPLGQIRYLEGVAQKAGLSEEALEEQAMALFGVPVHGLSRRDASHLAQILRSHEIPRGCPAGGDAEYDERTGATSPRRLAATPNSVQALRP
jgi:hypothetical protein